MTAKRHERAIEVLDAANSEDPSREVYEGRELPRELAYALRMTAWLERLEPDAPEELRLAVRAQHLCRFKIPRDSYPAGRSGYLKWRSQCQQMHATEAGRILKDLGYEDATIGRVQGLIRKERRHDDPLSQAVEDTACLVFLEGYLEGFSKRQDEAKLVEILRKTWSKMSPSARELALQIDLEPRLQGVVRRAVG